MIFNLINRQEDFPAVVSTLYKCPPANLYFPHVYSLKITFVDHLYSSSSQQLSSGGGEVLQISSDRDRRIFGGLKFSISGFFWVGKFCQVLFLVA